jgi:plasmid stabilization system protein ParE
MARVRKREAAKRDLIAQWLWCAENASVEVADRFPQAADTTLNLLATQPESGAPVFVHELELQGMRRTLPGGYAGVPAGSGTLAGLLFRVRPNRAWIAAIYV